MKYIIIIALTILITSQIFMLTHQPTIQEAQADQNQVPYKYIVNCWDESKGSEYSPEGKLNNNYNYCLIVPSDNWDF